jgi:hypothetical protein
MGGVVQPTADPSVVGVDRLPGGVTRIRWRGGREEMVDRPSPDATDWLRGLLVKIAAP